MKEVYKGCQLPPLTFRLWKTKNGFIKNDLLFQNQEIVRPCFQ